MGSLKLLELLVPHDWKLLHEQIKNISLYNDGFRNHLLVEKVWHTVYKHSAV